MGALWPAPNGHARTPDPSPWKKVPAPRRLIAPQRRALVPGWSPYCSPCRGCSAGERAIARLAGRLAMKAPRGLALAALALAAAAALCCATPAEDPKSVLVLLESLDQQASYSRFLQGLRDQGFSLDVRAISNANLQINDWDEWRYAKVAILASGPQPLGGALDAALLASFVEDGGDLLLALSSDAPEELRALAISLGVDAEPSGTAVVDHFAFDGALDEGEHTAVWVAAPEALPAVFRPSTTGPVLYRGVGLSVAPDSELAIVALGGSPTAYSGRPGQAVTETPLAGARLALVALVQGRNNARAAVSGSAELFSDEFFGAQRTARDGRRLGASGNADLAADVAAWAFHQRGVLRATPLRHRIAAPAERAEEQPELYRTNDEVEVELSLEQCAAGACAPFEAEDVQAELVMLDPYVRTTLRHEGGGLYRSRVKVPDVYGVFKWTVDYVRPGWSRVELVETVPIRPFRHDEYDRFLVQALPYYASAASMMAGFAAVGFYFLYTK